MKVQDLYTDIQKYYNLNYRDSQLINPRFIINDNKLTWASYKTKENKETYEEYFQWVLDNSQFSLQINDEALIQIFYEEDIKSKEVFRGSLSFLPRPDYLMSYFRFDFDRNAKIDYSHNSYHINFGYRSDDLRFSLKKFPYPSEFMNMVLFFLNKKEIKSFDKGNFYADLDSIGELYNHSFDFVTS